MNRLIRGKLWCAGLAVALLAAGLTAAQEKAPAPKAKVVAKAPGPVVAATTPAATVPSPVTPQRALAPGVLQTIDTAREVQETFSRHDVMELLATDADFEFAKEVAFRHDVWALDFKFKSMRLITVDIPQPTGVMKRTLVWYLVYAVTNTGKVMHPTETENQTYKVQLVDTAVRFIPTFLLVNHKDDKAYEDQIMPIAVMQIQRREGQPFCNTVDMCRAIAVGQTLWGVATWAGDTGVGDGIDPKIRKFSIYIGGLTNALRWKDKPDVYAQGDPARNNVARGRTLLRKTLKLNFWKAGDEYYLHEKEIRYGLPGELDYEWVWR